MGRPSPPWGRSWPSTSSPATPGIAEGLAPDDPILVHGTAARAALAAYCAGDTEALAASLAGIPFRSPYRDWAQILKALQRLPEQPEAAATLLARVADESAFVNLRRAAELALVPEADLATRLAGAGEATRRFALTLRGWGEERQALWQEAVRVGSSPQGLLRLMHRHRARLGEDWVRQGALRLLVAGPSAQPVLAPGGGRQAPDPRREGPGGGLARRSGARPVGGGGRLEPLCRHPGRGGGAGAGQRCRPAPRPGPAPRRSAGLHPAERRGLRGGGRTRPAWSPSYWNRA